MNANLAYKRREARMSGWTREDVNRIALKQQKSKPSKWKNVKTTVDGITFDSKKEAHRHHELKLLEKAGEIIDLQRQIPFQITVNGKAICEYFADFTYSERVASPFLDGTLNHYQMVVEDVKGKRTAMYRLKKKLVEAQYGIQIRET